MKHVIIYNIEVGQGSNVNVEVNGGNINLTTLSSGQDAGDINILLLRHIIFQIAGNINIGCCRSSFLPCASDTKHAVIIINKMVIF